MSIAASLNRLASPHESERSSILISQLSLPRSARWLKSETLQSHTHHPCTHTQTRTYNIWHQQPTISLSSPRLHFASHTCISRDVVQHDQFLKFVSKLCLEFRIAVVGREPIQHSLRVLVMPSTFIVYTGERMVFKAADEYDNTQALLACTVKPDTLCSRLRKAVMTRLLMAISAGKTWWLCRNGTQGSIASQSAEEKRVSDISFPSKRSHNPAGAERKREQPIESNSQRKSVAALRGRYQRTLVFGTTFRPSLRSTMLAPASDR